MKRIAFILTFIFSAIFITSAETDCPCSDWGAILFGPKGDRRFMAVKTNLMYDAALTPNIGLEAGFGDHLSVSADWMYAWWSQTAKGRFLRIYGGSVETRWWLRTDEWTGHHFGIYGGMATYDFEFGKNGVMSPDWTWSAGISYGYSFPLAKRLNIDLGISLGYVGGKHMDYCRACGDFRWKATKRTSYIGPTRIEASLVWLIGQPNLRKK